jgi:hypothetical protein
VATWLGLFGGLLSLLFVGVGLVVKVVGRSNPGWKSTVSAVGVIGGIHVVSGIVGGARGAVVPA